MARDQGATRGVLWEMDVEDVLAKDIDAVGGVSSNGGLYFGAEKTLEPANFFSGLVDDVRIYDEALSAEEVAELAR